MNRSLTVLVASLLTLAPLAASAAAPAGEEALSAAYSTLSEGMHAAVNAAKASPAALPGPAPISPAQWQTLVAKVREHGTYSPSDGQIPETYGLVDQRGPSDAAHLSNYINEWGYTDSAKVFHAGEVSLVSENWTIPADGNWHIDQWIFKLDTDGAITARAHITLVETRDGRVLADDAEQLKDGDPRITDKYNRLLSNWVVFPPHPKSSAVLTIGEGSAHPFTGARAAFRAPR